MGFSLRRRKSTVAPETLEATAEEHRNRQAANCGCRMTPYELGRAMLSLSPLIALPFVDMTNIAPSRLSLTSNYVYVARGMDYGVLNILQTLWWLHMLGFLRRSSVGDTSRQVCPVFFHM